MRRYLALAPSLCAIAVAGVLASMSVEVDEHTDVTNWDVAASSSAAMIAIGVLGFAIVAQKAFVSAAQRNCCAVEKYQPKIFREIGQLFYSATIFSLIGLLSLFILEKDSEILRAHFCIWIIVFIVVVFAIYRIYQVVEKEDFRWPQ